MTDTVQETSERSAPTDEDILLDERDGELRIQLAGDKLQGVASLTRKAVIGVRWSWKLE